MTAFRPAAQDGPVVAILNPARRHAERIARLLPAVCREAGRDLRIERTTVERPGCEQARAAAAAGAARVVVAGGDGTVRQVAAGLAGTGVVLGIIPTGTANLFALNLGLRRRRRHDRDGLRHDLRAAVSGVASPHDVGRIEWGESGGLDGLGGPGAAGAGAAPHRDTFLVVAGLGEDAATVAATSEALKARAGWPAYLLRGLRRLRAPRHRLRISVDGGAVEEAPAWSLLVGSAPRIPAGIRVFPGTRTDSGTLEVLRAAPASLRDWAGIGWFGLSGRAHRAAALHYVLARTVEAVPERPLPLQLDGDVLGRAARVRVRIDPRALRIAR